MYFMKDQEENQEEIIEVVDEEELSVLRRALSGLRGTKQE